jgi:S1-C subfamily serine protease
MGLGLLLVWVIACLLITHVMTHVLWDGFRAGLSQDGSKAADRSQFEVAFRWVSQLDASDAQAVPNAANVRSGNLSKFGIGQITYNRWRRSQNLPFQPIAELSEAEAQTLYQAYWQEEQCDRYAPPLDATCLDTVVSFNLGSSNPGSNSEVQRFFADLPADPQTAAIAVAQRRMDYRQQRLASAAPAQIRLPEAQAAPFDRSPYRVNSGDGSGLRPQRSPQSVAALGLRRDRALLAQLETYQPPQPSSSISSFLQWLRSSFYSPAPALPQPLSSGEIYAKAEPFTVEVWITLEDGTYAPATGVVVDADGLILTNAHVVENNPRPTIHIRDQQQNEQTYDGQVVADDLSVDLALIQLSGASGLPIAPWAESSTQVKVGDTVYALGSPVGFHWKLTQSKVIEVQSQCGVPGLRCIRMPRNFLHPGNSGGPLLDVTGQVIGINRAVQGRTGEGVSIPVEDVKRFLRQQGK